MTCGVYCLKAADGKLYVGSSRNIEQRMIQLRRYSGLSRKLKAAFDKGPVEYCVLEECAGDVLRQREQSHIEKLRPALNTLLFPHKDPDSIEKGAFDPYQGSAQ